MKRIFAIREFVAVSVLSLDAGPHHDPVFDATALGSQDADMHWRERAMGEVGRTPAALIAVDWGTTNRRGYLIGRDATVLDRCQDGAGLANIENGRFGPALDALVAPWIEAHGALPALLSGMVGASTGWREAPYCDLPVGLDDLATKMVRAPGDRPAWLVPGLAVRVQGVMPDVMRGEEVQAFAAARGGSNRWIVLPGTHSKWVRMEADRIVGFKSFMTGDLHAAVLNHTVISILAAGTGTGSGNAFRLGVQEGRARHGELTHILFGARSRVLFGELTAEDAPDYLSGLLIGAEIAGVLETDDAQSGTVLVVGDDALAALYYDALALCGIGARVADMRAIGEVYSHIARRAGLLEETRP